MKQVSINYAVVLYQLSIPQEAVQETARLFGEIPQLTQVLASPVTPLAQKHRVIDRVFPTSMRAFLKEVCDSGNVESIGDIFTAYHSYSCSQRKILLAQLRCVTRPSPAQLDALGRLLCRKYSMSGIEWTVSLDPSLIGGFVIQVGDIETDQSLKGRLGQLQQKLCGGEQRGFHQLK